MFDIGPQSSSDNNFVAKYRLHQSKYRCETLKENYGYGPAKTSINKLGSMLINGEKTGSNFISGAAFKYATQRSLDKNINKDLTIEPYRLFNNMLSSMPMCFNLFSDLRELLVLDKNLCSEVCKILFKEISWISTIEYIGVEFIPTPIERYTNDKTAFDAILIVKDKNDKKGVISIETKYTDLLGSNSSKNVEHKNKLVEKYNIFSADLKSILKKNGYKQIYRNYLLTFAFSKINKFKNFCNIILSPSEDKVSAKEILEIENGLDEKKDTIIKIDLEEFINRGILTDKTGVANHFKNLQQRYIVK